jgi:5S rRNA maturation endonuclease (ribonuclease M5)
MSLDLKSLARALGGEVSGGQVLGPGPGHTAKDRSLSVKPDAKAPDGFVIHSFAHDDVNECRDYVRQKAGLGVFTPRKPNGGKRFTFSKKHKPEVRLRSATKTDPTCISKAETAPKPTPEPENATSPSPETTTKNRQVVATFDYTDNGVLLYQVIKYEPKGFAQRRPDGNGGWVGSVKGCRRVLYRLADLLKDTGIITVFVTEGEKDADRVASLGHVAVTVACGDWQKDCIEALRGRDVIILEDADKAGVKQSNKAAALLHGVAKSVRVVRLPGQEHTAERGGKDVSDWLDADPKNADRLTEVCTAAPLWTPPEVETKGEDEDEPPKMGAVHWHGEINPLESRPQLVDGVLPEIGCGLISGQWGTYKSFAALDLAASVMTGKPFITFPVVRKGGVLFIAAEGASEMSARIEAAVKAKDRALDHAPFAWLDRCPALVNPDTTTVLVAWAKEIADAIMEKWQLPLVLIIIDTIVATAGYSKSGEDNDAAVGQRVMTTLADLAKATGTFVLGVDHFGKNVETGTRGTSAKEGAADVVLAMLGERSIAGKVTDTRLALRKRRGGENGQEFPFAARLVELGVNQSGARETTLTIDWTTDAVEAAMTSKKDGRWSKSLSLLRRVLLAVMADTGKEVCPFADGPKVQACDLALVQAEFFKQYAADGTAKQKYDARRHAFDRAVKSAQNKEPPLVMVREIGDQQLIWFAKESE